MTFKDFGRAIAFTTIGWLLGQGSLVNGVTTAHVVDGGMVVARNISAQFKAPPAEAAPKDTRAQFIPAFKPDGEDEEVVVHERRRRRG